MTTKARAQARDTVTAPSALRGKPANVPPPAPTAPRLRMHEEAFFRNDSVSLCLLINRRARTMRVVDFRAGASPRKREVVQAIARREGLDKVVVLVERDESITWSKMGFQREGNIPGFYKRSDAYVMGMLVQSQAATNELSIAAKIAGPRSGVFSVTERLFARPIEPEATEDESLEEEASPAAIARAEKTVAAARKIAREIGDALPVVKLAPIAHDEIARRVATMSRQGRAISGFEPFGRDVAREDMVASCRAHGEVIVGAEIQPSYRNAFLELIAAPVDDRERAFFAAAVSAACARLEERGTVCSFAVTPVDDVRLAAVFALCGFRRTGLLRQHLRIGSARVDGLLWSRKLATGDAES